MGYQLKTVCDLCGAEFPIPMATFGDIAEQTNVFLRRIYTSIQTPFDTPVNTLCGACADKGPPPGAAILSGDNTVTMGKKGDGN